MLDEQKVKLMTRLALYEQTDGKEDFKISEYYRKDYASMHTICAIIWVTVGYACLIGLIVLVCMDSLMGKMSNGVIIALGLIIVVGYLVVLIIYSVVANHIYNQKHRNARQRVKKYNHDLIRLLKIYEKEKQ